MHMVHTIRLWYVPYAYGMIFVPYVYGGTWFFGAIQLCKINQTVVNTICHCLYIASTCYKNITNMSVYVAMCIVYQMYIYFFGACYVANYISSCKYHRHCFQMHDFVLLL